MEFGARRCTTARKSSSNNHAHGALGQEVPECRRGSRMHNRFISVDLSPGNVEIPVEVIACTHLRARFNASEILSLSGLGTGGREEDTCATRFRSRHTHRLTIRGFQSRASKDTRTALAETRSCTHLHELRWPCRHCTHDPLRSVSVIINRWLTKGITAWIRGPATSGRQTASCTRSARGHHLPMWTMASIRPAWQSAFMLPMLL